MSRRKESFTIDSRLLDRRWSAAVSAVAGSMLLARRAIISCCHLKLRASKLGASDKPSRSFSHTMDFFLTVLFAKLAASQ